MSKCRPLPPSPKRSAFFLPPLASESLPPAKSHSQNLPANIPTFLGRLDCFHHPNHADARFDNWQIAALFSTPLPRVPHSKFIIQRRPVPSSVPGTPESNVRQVRRRATRARLSVQRGVPRDFFRRRGRPRDGLRLCLRRGARSIG